MAPPCNVFPVSKLELHVQADVKGKKRKLPGGADVDLTNPETARCDVGPYTGSFDSEFLASRFPLP
ncbi:hypothetical protein CSHISOI_10831 [Colletotrichum shisoi]|uniref:Uncharacterized protein n=1 Tax=Colletotrichum shisoi TaxID=2078593 RepID=A0A5Q4BCF7_9PEZI|nr:hypothetical protein CSHISOI_10831 [Colletotrichum shisoi]